MNLERFNMYPNKCLLCKKEVEIYDDSFEVDDSRGHVQISCGYGSKFDYAGEDGLSREIIRQAVICDTCIRSHLDLMRKIEVITERNVRWQEID